MVECLEGGKVAPEVLPKLTVGGDGCSGTVHIVSVFATNKAAIPIDTSVWDLQLPTFKITGKKFLTNILIKKK